MKKKIYISITMILLLALCISLCACLTGCGNSSENIKLGYTHDEVRKIMGDPYEDLSSDYTWCYLGSSYTNVLNQIAKNEEAQEEALMKGDLKRLIDLANQEEELQAKLETTVYEYTEITFVRDEAKGYIVNSVMFDKNRCNAYPIDKREVKSVEVEGDVKVDVFKKRGDNEKAICTGDTEISEGTYYTAYYTDGSYRLAYLPDVEAVEATAESAKITWSDSLATYETNVDVQIIGTVENQRLMSIDSDIGKNLTSLTIPDSITSIYFGALSDCDNLTSITLPFVGEGLSGYGRTHFGCIFGYNGRYFVPDTLKEVIITGGNSIDDYAFEDCANIERITIPGSVTSIGDYAFDGCSNLTSITIPNSVTSIGDYAFLDCRSLESITIPDSITSIGDEAFSGCRSLESITIPNSVTSIGDSAFSGCTNLESITIPSSITSIGDGVFEGCDSLNYNQDDNAYYLGNETNPYLVLVKAKSADISTCQINSQTKFISYGAFSGCTSLESITLPFVGATLNGDKYTHFSYIFGAPIAAAYNDSYVPASLKEVIITGGNSIGSFSGCANIEHITIPSSVTSIGSYAFYNCTSLDSITIPSNVTSIGSYAFRGCNSLKSMTLPFVGTTYNGDEDTNFGYLFEGPSTVPASLKEVIITGGNSIGNEAFKDCASIESITIPNSVTSIGDYAFLDCRSLESITIPDSITSIGDEAFSGCRSLESITIPNSVTAIGDSAFSGCTRLTSVTIGNNITIEGSATSIGRYAFNGCTNLTNVTIGNSVTSIGERAFDSCANLSSVTIGNSVTSIGTNAFYNCDGLTSITIPRSVTSIGGAAFGNCDRLKTINYNGTTAEWQSVSKSSTWGYYTDYTVYCTDGTVSKDGTVTPNA